MLELLLLLLQMGCKTDVTTRLLNIQLPVTAAAAVWLQDHILQVQPGPLSMQLANTAAATAATPIQKQLTAAQGPSRSSERQPCRNAAKAYASVLRAQLGPS